MFTECHIYYNETILIAHILSQELSFKDSGRSGRGPTDEYIQHTATRVLLRNHAKYKTLTGYTPIVHSILVASVRML